MDLIDHTEEDFNRDEAARATGFIGKASEINWLQKLSKEVNNECEVWSASMSNSGDDNGLPSPTLTPRPDNPSDPLMASANYYLDDMDIPSVNKVDPYEVPSKEVATKLLNAYLASVHPSFPIIGISTFVSQFQVFFSQPSLRPGNRWLAILNLIFAIAAKYAHLTEAEWKEDDNDHYVYFSRAKTLSLEDQLLHHPDLQQLQVEGLACFYMVASGHINRSVSPSNKMLVILTRYLFPGHGSCQAVQSVGLSPLAYIYAMWDHARLILLKKYDTEFGGLCTRLSTYFPS